VRQRSLGQSLAEPLGAAATAAALPMPACLPGVVVVRFRRHWPRLAVSGPQARARPQPQDGPLCSPWLSHLTSPTDSIGCAERLAIVPRANADRRCCRAQVSGLLRDAIHGKRTGSAATPRWGEMRRAGRIAAFTIHTLFMCVREPMPERLSAPVGGPTCCRWMWTRASRSTASLGSTSNCMR
jgi:hypothetical protein